MSKIAPNPPPVESWLVGNLQMVAFPASPFTDFNVEWWKLITGEDPDSTTRRKTERVDVGVVNNAQLTLSMETFRIQLTATAVLTPQNIAQAPSSNIGPYPEIRDWFTSILTGLWGQLPPLQRVAFLSFLIQPVDDHEAAYRRLNQYLRSVEVDPESADLQYRINRKRPSQVVAGLTVNRLITWMAFKSVAANLTALAAGGRSPIVDQSYYCGLTLDINTAAEYSGEAFTVETASRLFGELREWGTEIATQGDIK